MTDVCLLILAWIWTVGLPWVGLYCVSSLAVCGLWIAARLLATRPRRSHV